MAEHRIAVAGAGGRMGRAVLKEVLRTPGLSLAGGFERLESEYVGKDLGPFAGVDALGMKIEPSMDKVLGDASAVIDFTAPEASIENAKLAAENGVAYVVGTTGFDAVQVLEIAVAAEQVPIVKSGNMSLGVNLLAELVRQAAECLPASAYDIEIFEAHHRKKVDAPSGTALMLGGAASEGRSVALKDVKKLNRRGARKTGDIGFSVMRGGGVIGDHDVYFAGVEEVITLSHRAIDRGLFAKGAVAAAQWAGRQAGWALFHARCLGFFRIRIEAAQRRVSWLRFTARFLPFSLGLP